MDKHIPLDFVKSEALKLGFQDCGAAKADLCEHSRLKEWLSENYNADMAYMAAFSSLVLYAKSEDCKLFFISGDLFDDKKKI